MTQAASQSTTYEESSPSFLTHIFTTAHCSSKGRCEVPLSLPHATATVPVASECARAAEAEAVAPRTERHLGGIWTLGEMSIEQTIADSSFARWKTAAIGATHVGELSMNCEYIHAGECSLVEEENRIRNADER